MADYSTGLELVLNACEGALQTLLSENEKTLCFEQWHQPQKAAEILMPALQAICGRLQISLKDFRRIGCVAGPGSFTGIRLVLATAAAMRRTSRAKLASLDYLQALATSAVMRRGLLYPGKVFVITHARRELVHFREFISFGPVIPAQPAHEVELLSPAAALRKIAAGPCLVCGSGLARHEDVFAAPVTGQGPNGAAQAIMLPELIHPDMCALALLGRHGDYFPEDVEPKYVRGCDAVEQLIAAKGSDCPEIKELEKQLQKA